MSRTKSKAAAKRKRQQQLSAAAAPPDFEKKKQKLGARRRPDNWTDTSVSTRQIHVPNQQRSTSLSIPSQSPTTPSSSNATGYTLPELLGRVSHYNIPTRISALNALYNAIFNPHAVCHDAVHARAPAVIGAAAVALTDDKATVRVSAINLMLSPLLDKNLLPIVGAQTMAALTHLRKDVQFTAVEMIPRLMTFGQVVKVMPQCPLDALTKMLNYVTSNKHKAKIMLAIAAAIKNMCQKTDTQHEEGAEKKEIGDADIECKKNMDKGEEDKDCDEDEDDDDDEDEDEPEYFFHRHPDMAHSFNQEKSILSDDEDVDVDDPSSSRNERSTVVISLGQWHKLLRIVCATLSDSLPATNDNHNHNYNQSQSQNQRYGRNTQAVNRHTVFDEEVMIIGLDTLYIILAHSSEILHPSSSSSTSSEQAPVPVPKCVLRVLKACFNPITQGLHLSAAIQARSVERLADCALCIGHIELCSTLLAEHVDDFATVAVARLLHAQYGQMKGELHPWATQHRVDSVVDGVVQQFIRHVEQEERVENVARCMGVLKVALKWAVRKRMPCVNYMVGENVIPKAIKLAILALVAVIEEEEPKEVLKKNDNENEMKQATNNKSNHEQGDGRNDKQRGSDTPNDTQKDKGEDKNDDGQGRKRKSKHKESGTKLDSNACRALQVQLMKLLAWLCRAYGQRSLVGPKPSSFGVDTFDDMKYRGGVLVDGMLRLLCDATLNFNLCEEAARQLCRATLFSNRICSEGSRDAIAIGLVSCRVGKTCVTRPSPMSLALLDTLEWAGVSGMHTCSSSSSPAAIRSQIRALCGLLLRCRSNGKNTPAIAVAPKGVENTTQAGEGPQPIVPVPTKWQPDEVDFTLERIKRVNRDVMGPGDLMIKAAIVERVDEDGKGVLRYDVY